jgi:hypothetical protein
MSSQLESIYSDELILLAETLGEVKTRTEKLEGEFSTHAKPLEAATNALSAALSGIKALQFHVLDNNLGALSARVEEMRKAVDEQVGVIALELKKADETNAAKAGADAEALRSEIVALQSQLGSLVTQFGQQLERVEFAAKEEAKKLQLIPGPAGAAGASLNPRGTFIDGEVYNRLDVVSWLGSSYIATVDGVTEKPSKNSNQWQTLASRGGGGAGGVGDFGSLAGVAQINQGGTGQTTRALALNALLPDQAGSTQYMLLTDGSGTVSWGAQPVAGLPSQTSNSGRLLTTNGSTASWSNAVTVSGSNATVGGTLSTVGNATVGTSGNAVLTLGTSGAAYTHYIYGATAGGAIQIKSDPATTDRHLSLGSINNSYVYTEMLKLANTGVVTIPGTTASTTTSSGALVVSGGVGVAGNVSSGGQVAATGTGTSGPYIANSAVLDYDSSTARFYGRGPDTSTRPSLGFYSTYSNGAGGLALMTFNASGAATIGGNLTASGTGSHVFGTTNTVTLSSGAVTANGIISTTAAAQRVINTNGAFQIYKDATPTGAARFSYNTAAADTISLGVYDGSSWTDTFRVTTTQALVTTSTASTSTSSGALVVSGGVGVAGDVYAGGTTGFKLGSSSAAYRFSAGAYVDAESSSIIRLLDSTGNFATVKTGSLIASTPGTAPSLTVNSTMTFELTSNTTLKVFVRGTDGTNRSVSLTLA